MRLPGLSRVLGAACVAAISTPANATIDTIINAVVFAADFVDAGFSMPTIIMNETESTFRLSITGGPVGHTVLDDSASFTAPIILNFWRGNVTFSQVDGLVNSDSVTASITLFHQAGIDRPHPGDQLQGDPFTFPTTTLQVGNAAVKFGGTESHPKSHSDRFFDGLFSVGGVGDTINGWNFVLKADHLAAPVPEPRAWVMMLIGFGIIGASVRRRHRIRAA